MGFLYLFYERPFSDVIAAAATYSSALSVRGSDRLYRVSIACSGPLKEHVLDKRKLAVPSLRRLLEEITRRSLKFDSMGFNSLIRALLKIHFVVENFTGELYLENYFEISSALDRLLESSYKELHSLTKLDHRILVPASRAF